MIMAEILTPTQINLLKAIGKESAFTEHFYLSGGTALAGFYLHHRYSEDLDFFSMEEVDPMPISIFFKRPKNELGITGVTSETKMNRNLFFLTIGKEEVKTEFTYFPFTQIDPPQKEFGIFIDSPKDIAVNKLFTIYQRSTARDYIDLYCLNKKYGWAIDQLIAWAKIKFDWHIDPIQLANQFIKSEEVVDYPRMIEKIQPEEWRNFFKQEAIKLKGDIIQ